MKKQNFEYVNGLITYIELFRYIPKNTWFCHYCVDGESMKYAPHGDGLPYSEFVSFFKDTFGLDIPDNPDELILNVDNKYIHYMEDIVPYIF